MHIVIAHDHFQGPTGMGRVVERHARWVLDAGHRLTAIGDNVPAWLTAEAAVVAAPRPRRLPALPEHLGWCARAATALRRVRADVVHVHAPLLAAQADLLTTHFIAKAAHARGVRDEGEGLEPALRRAQSTAVVTLDDLAYRVAARRTAVSFVSEFLREEFRTHYGDARGGWVLAPPAPAWAPFTSQERAAARARWNVPSEILVAGYLGGNDPRKGWQHLAALGVAADIHVMVAGPGSEDLPPETGRRVGFVDPDEFLAACDVLLVPASFDSAPVAALQALARGVPIVASPTCGWAPNVARTGAGAVWDPASDLADAVRRAAAASPEALRAMVEAFSEQRGREALLGAYAALTAR